MVEFEEWHPVEELPASFNDANVSSQGSGILLVRLLAGSGGIGGDLVFEFTQVWGVTIHDEQHHPDLHSNIPWWGAGNAFPCLIKRRSDWRKSLHQTYPLFDELIHYQLITHGSIVDVLSDGEPDKVYWA